LYTDIIVNNQKNLEYKLTFTRNIENIKNFQVSVLFKRFKYKQTTQSSSYYLENENMPKEKYKIKKYFVPKRNLTLLKDFCYFYNFEQGFIFDISKNIFYSINNEREFYNIVLKFPKSDYYYCKGSYFFNVKVFTVIKEFNKFI
jgi:hypothetical protein